MLSDVLTKLRKTNGYTQEEIAEKCGVSRQAVSKWEQGISVPDIYNCQALCDLYGIDMGDLVKSDEQDLKSVGPIGKYVFGYVKIEKDGYIRLPKSCLLKMNIEEGDEMICLGDITQGIAIVPSSAYEKFADELMRAKKEMQDGNNKN